MDEKNPRSLGGTKYMADFTIRCDVPAGQMEVNFGKPLKPGERAAIIADNWGLKGEGSVIDISWMAPTDETYRMAFLFNDVVDLPSFLENICPPDVWGLEDLGLIQRSRIRSSGVVMYENVSALETALLKVMDTQEPGAWSLWREPGYDPVPPRFQVPGASVRIALQDAIIIPGIEVPFGDVVDFRQRNTKLLRKLRRHLDELAIKIAATGPDPAAFRLEIEKLDESIAEYTEEARKPNWKKALGSIDYSIDWGKLGLAELAAAGAANFAALTLPQAAAALAIGAVPAISLKTTRGIAGLKKNSPFEYIVRARRDLI